MQLFMKHPFSDYKVLHIFRMRKQFINRIFRTRKQFINRIKTILKVETHIIACITVNPRPKLEAQVSLYRSPDINKSS